tara:strand:- start:37 stop:1023 length:987 start_codon:yes stop_codon:yes gene_type:complete
MPALISQPNRITGTVALVLSVLAILLAVSIQNTECASASSGSCPVGDIETFASGISINTDLTTNDSVISGDTDANLFFADSSTDRIGIGLNTPTELLDVAGNVAITGGGTLSLATDLAVVHGGTGVGTFTDAGVLIGNGTGNLAVTSAGTALQVLTSNGPGVDPTFQTAGGGGIDQWDQWRLTTDFSNLGGGIYLTSNLERSDTNGFAVLGSGMTESSGLFTFPDTGHWMVQYTLSSSQTWVSHNPPGMSGAIYYTDDNWVSDSNAVEAGGIGHVTNGTTIVMSGLFVITDVANQKVKFLTNSTTASGTVKGNTSYNKTYINFIRIAE